MEHFRNLDGATGFEMAFVGLFVMAVPWIVVIGAGAWVFVKLSGWRRGRKGRET